MTIKGQFLPGIDNLLDNVLGVCPSDCVLLAGDIEKEDVVSKVICSLKRRKIPYSQILVDYDGQKIPLDLSKKLLDDDHNVVLLFFSKSIWHQEERRRAKYEKKKRMVSFSGTLDMLVEGPALADPGQIKKICDDLKPHIQNGTHIELKAPNGTHISGRCSSFGFETGLYTEPGEGGNFPAGEIYSFGLIDESINGFVHSNIKVKHLGLSSPENNAIFEVSKGKIVPVTDKPAPHFFSFIKDFPELFYVGELAFGINPYKKYFSYPDCIQEEKILGTAHVGLGSNISFGGKRKGRHIDLVFGPATVTVNDKLIVIEGDMNPAYLSDESKKWVHLDPDAT